MLPSLVQSPSANCRLRAIARRVPRGNLKFTTDFRSVYASVLDRWIGVPSAEILGGAYAPIEGLLG